MALTPEPYVHDPLCPQADPYSTQWRPKQRHWSCHCDLIAEVRTDERRKSDVPWFSSEYHRGYRQGHADATKKKGARDA